MFKSAVVDKSISQILSGHKHLTLNKAYQIALSITELDEIKEAKTNQGE